MKIVNSEQMRRIDRRAIEELEIPSIVLMENAALAALEAIALHFADAEQIAIFCGTGMNGGDGFALARHLFSAGKSPRLFLLGDRQKCQGDAAVNLSICESLGLAITRIESQKDLHQALEAATGSDLIIDAIFGTGLNRAASGIQGDCILALNDVRTPILALDLPSGLDASSPQVPGPAVQAKLTVTFVVPKICHIFPPASLRCGEVIVADISIPSSIVDAESIALSVLSPDRIALLVPPREADSHKGSHGHVAIVAGSEGKSGAAILAARGALHSGAGLITVITDRRTARLVDTVSIESMSLPARVAKSELDTIVSFIEGKITAVAIGPGLVDDEKSWSAIRELISRIEKPLVIDASALNAFASRIEELNPEGRVRVITPHPGELSRLLNRPTAAIQDDRRAAALDAARLSNCVVILKGSQTLVAHPDGDLAVNPTGNPGMASGGMGDVLTGVVVTLLGQQHSAWDAACAGVYLHGSAGDLLAAEQGEIGLAASDLAARIPLAIRNLR